jgi:hypothetical protein
LEILDAAAEAKYTFAIGETDVLLHALNCLCIPDPSYAQGRINSVYFDTADRRFLAAKVNSDYLKTKIRLRWYSNVEGDDLPETVQAYMERKEKVGFRRMKERKQVLIPSEILREGLENYADLATLTQTMRFDDWVPPGPLFPMITIRYVRRRFVDPLQKARLSLDSRICFSSVNSSFFPYTDPRMLREGVLEVKSESGDLPAALRPFRDRLNTRNSFSKYEECWQLHADVNYRRELKSLGAL